MINNKLGYCCSTNNSIGKTLDGGITWSLINTGISYISNTQNKIIDIYAFDISNILIASGFNIFKSYDSGNSWISISGFIGQISAVNFINENGYLSSGNYIYSSFDYGLTWPIVLNTTYTVTNLYMASKKFLIYGTNTTIIGSINNGNVVNINNNTFTIIDNALGVITSAISKIITAI
jgi:hypothetical protein